MSDFALELPQAEGFFHLLDAVLRIEGRAHIAYLFAGADCSLEGSASPLPGVGGCFRARINIGVPIERVHFFTDEVRWEIRRAANQILPPSVGYRVAEIKVSPFPAPVQSQSFTLEELIGKVNRLRGSRAEIEVRIGTARELLKAACMLILNERNPSLEIGSNWGIVQRLREAEKVLTLVPPELSLASQDATRRVLEKLSSMAQNLEMAELNDTKRAGVAVWAASTLIMYLIDSHQPPGARVALET